MNTVHNMFLVQLGSEYPWTQYTTGKWNSLPKPTNFKPKIRQLLSCSELCILQVTHSCFMSMPRTVWHIFHFRSPFLILVKFLIILFYAIKHKIWTTMFLYTYLIKWPSKRSDKCYWHKHLVFYFIYTLFSLMKYFLLVKTFDSGIKNTHGCTCRSSHQWRLQSSSVWHHVAW